MAKYYDGDGERYCERCGILLTEKNHSHCYCKKCAAAMDSFEKNKSSNRGKFKEKRKFVYDMNRDDDI